MYVCVVYAFACVSCTCVVCLYGPEADSVSSLITLHIVYWARVSLSSKFIISASLASQFALRILSLSLACWNHRQPAMPSWLFKWVQWIWTLVLRLVQQSTLPIKLSPLPENVLFNDNSPPIFCLISVIRYTSITDCIKHDIVQNPELEAVAVWSSTQLQT